MFVFLEEMERVFVFVSEVFCMSGGDGTGSCKEVFCISGGDGMGIAWSLRGAYIAPLLVFKSHPDRSQAV